MGSLLGCAAGRAFENSLLEVRSAGGVNGPNPASDDVVQEFRFAVLDLCQLGDLTVWCEPLHVIVAKKRKEKSGGDENVRPRLGLGRVQWCWMVEDWRSLWSVLM